MCILNVHVCAQALIVCLCQRQWQVSPSGMSSTSFEAESLITLELTRQARLVGQWGPGIPLCLPPQHYVQHCLISPRDWSDVLMPWGKPITEWAPLRALSLESSLTVLHRLVLNSWAGRILSLKPLQKWGLKVHHRTWPQWELVLFFKQWKPVHLDTKILTT